MKTPSISPVAVMLITCGLVAASVQPLLGQKKGLPVPQVNNNQNGNQNPPPAVVKKVVARRVTETQLKVEAIPKQMDPPGQKRVEQPKLPPGMKRMGPGTVPDQLKDLAKLKLLPPMRRGGNEAGNATLAEGVDAGNTASFPPIGDSPLDRLGDRIRDIAFAEEAGGIGDLAGTLGFADLLNGRDGMAPGLGLGGSGDGNGFADADELAGFGGVGGGSRQDGLPDDAPPSGWGALGGIAGNGFVDRSTDENGVERKTVVWTESNAESGVTTVYRQSSSSDGETFESETELNPDGSQRRDTRSQGGGGSDSQSTREVDANGNGFVDTYTRQSNGNVVMVHQDITNGQTGPASDPVRVTGSQVPLWLQIRGLGTNPGDEGQTESQRALARWMWNKHNLGRQPSGGVRADMGKLVNPGDPDYAGAYASYPSIGAGFSEAIAVNPDPNSMSGGGSTPSARAWRLMMEDLKSGATPGPMPGEKDPRGGR